MKKFSINCDFGGQIAPFTVYIGLPKPGNHALDHQAKWLGSNRQGTIPAEVMDAIAKLQELADKNGVLLEELCVYALGNDDEKSNSSETSPEFLEDQQSNDDQTNSEDSTHITS